MGPRFQRQFSGRYEEPCGEGLPSRGAALSRSSLSRSLTLILVSLFGSLELTKQTG